MHTTIWLNLETMGYMYMRGPYAHLQYAVGTTRRLGNHHYQRIA
jgi:hypothetical protein